MESCHTWRAAMAPAAVMTLRTCFMVSWANRKSGIGSIQSSRTGANDTGQSLETAFLHDCPTSSTKWYPNQTFLLTGVLHGNSRIYTVRYEKDHRFCMSVLELVSPSPIVSAPASSMARCVVSLSISSSAVQCIRPTCWWCYQSSRKM